MRIVFESITDVESRLKGGSLVNKIVKEFGSSLSDYDSSKISYFVKDLIDEEFGEDTVEISVVEVCKVQGEDVNTLSTDHSVIKYNGKYYDFAATEFTDSFTSLSNKNLPVIQQVIKSEKQINDKLSTVKGYVILDR